MSDIIRLLPDHVANQIAAGEVVQRPASVVKELLENSVDASATNIVLVVKDAGRTLVQVTDNGQGMTPTDARLSFERHATSKIRSADDLSAVRTKGFRGEALASIAAIAQVELRTRRPEDELGTRVLIEGSRVKTQEAIATQSGSSISVRSLFFNVPARRQFLKSDTVELKHVIDEFQRVALAHPEIAMQLIHNDAEVHHLEIGNERQRIVHVFGRKYDERLVPVEEGTDHVQVHGFVSKPEFAKRSRGEQYFFVNHRFIRSNYLEHAIRTAYDELVTRDNYPSWFLFITIDPAWIDINIHPTKTEIKFRDDRTVYAIVHAAVRRALGRHNITPSLDFEPEPALLAMAGMPNVRPVAPITRATPDWRPNDIGQRPSPVGWQQLFDLDSPQPVKQHDAELPGGPPAQVLPMREHADTGARPVFQLHGRYILAQLRTGIVVIDQQRAHERIVYERAMRSLEKGHGSSQAQLFPVSVELNAADHALMMGIMPDLAALGFQLEPLSGRSVAVNGLPAESGDEEPVKLLEQLLEQVKSERGTLKAERHATLARGMARSLARGGARPMAVAEMHDLIDRLFACEMPYFTPGGKPVLITYTLEELDERFERGMRYNPGGNFLSGIPTVIKNLLIVNGLVFLFKALDPIPRLTGDLDTLLGLHYITSPLFRPWQLLTHMFMHGNLWHLLLNMLGLFMLGPRVEYRWGSKRFLTYYLLCGFGAALIYMGWQWVGTHNAVQSLNTEQLSYVREQVIAYSRNEPAYHTDVPAAERAFQLWWVPMVGASGALFGILVAFGMLYPNVELTTFVGFIPINMKAKWFVMMYAAVELFSGVADVPGDNTAHFAHIGGLVVGFFLVRYYEKRNLFHDQPF